MKIRHYLIHRVEGEAPFKGAIINLPKDSKDGVRAEPETIIEQVKIEKNEGVMFSGDWYKRGNWFVALMREIQIVGDLQIMIYTDLEIDDFIFEMGLVFWNISNDTKLKRKDVKYEKQMIIMLGATILENYFTSDTIDQYWVMAKFEGENRVYQMNRGEEDVTEEVMN